jgi:hypothetical protein
MKPKFSERTSIYIVYVHNNNKSSKYNGNISFDKDIESAKRFGKQRLDVELIN